MLKTSNDFEEAVNYINDTLVTEINEVHSDQTNYLKSDAFNDTFSTFEKRINSLYEASRMMEDMIDYTKQYLTQNINDAIDKCEDIIQEINNTKDSVRTKEYTSYTVKLYEGTGSYLDRDGSELYHVDISSKKLILPSQSSVDIPIKTIEKNSGLVPYRNSISDLVNGKVYRSYYILDSAVSGGIKEEITVTLNSSEIFNYVSIVTSNCAISGVKFIDDNNTTYNDTDFDGSVDINKKIKEVVFTITCSAYTTDSIQVDKTRMSSDFLTSINEYEYDKTTGITTAYDLETASGMTQYKTDYAKYQTDLASWQAAKDAWPAYVSVNQDPIINYVPQQITSKIKVYGTGADLKNAENVLGYTNYQYIDTATTTSYTLTSNDIVVGGVGAAGGVGDINLNGATRLWGTDRQGTLDAIQSYESLL